MKFLWGLVIVVGVPLVFLIAFGSGRLLISGVGKLPPIVEVLIAPAILVGVIYLYRKNNKKAKK